MHYATKANQCIICVKCANNNPAFRVIEEDDLKNKRITEKLPHAGKSNVGKLLILIGVNAGLLLQPHHGKDAFTGDPIEDSCLEHDSICSECRKRCCNHVHPYKFPSMDMCFMCDLEQYGITESIKKIYEYPNLVQTINKITGLEFHPHDPESVTSLQKIKFARYVRDVHGRDQYGALIYPDYHHAATVDFLAKKAEELGMKFRKPPKPQPPREVWIDPRQKSLL